MKRRQFIQTTAGAAAFLAARRAAYAFYQSPATIPLFGTKLRGVGLGGIPVAAPDVDSLGTLIPAPVTGVKHYTININQYEDPGVVPTILPAAGNPGAGGTTLWGYHPANPLGGAQTQKHLGGIIVGKKDEPIQITFRNNLPSTHILPNDATIPSNTGANRTAVHFHGGLVPWISDGGPFDWWDPSGNHGLSFLNNVKLNPGAASNEAEYYYPLNQSARFGWYHDHAYGITRINAYAGIASALLIRDSFEAGLVASGLPGYIESGGYELPLIIQDKTFVGSDVSTVDPSYQGLKTSGSLWYAHLYEPARWAVGKNPAISPLPDPSCIPEFFGDTMLANGTAFPTAAVEPRRYRLRILNACNARFLNLQLFIDDGSPNGITLSSQGVPLNVPARNAAAPNLQGKPTSNFLVIGSEGGFLPSATWVPMNAPINPALFNGSLLLAPAERSDVIVDFSAHAGQKLILYTDAPAPFPVGDPRYDYFPGLNPQKNPVNATTPAGKGPNTRVIMRFDVAPAATGTPDGSLTIARGTSLADGIDPLIVPVGVTTPPPGIPVRPLTLNEDFDSRGRLIQLLGTGAVPAGKVGFGLAYTDPVTETVKAGATEVWQIANLTGDTHPIHFHLVNVQIISRQPFMVKQFNGTPNYTGPARGPDPEERGWKETVRMNPGEVTTVIMKFDLTGAAIKTATGELIATPLSTRCKDASGATISGHEYVWHCHILEHEEHDMMRPLVVL
jgi:spore coat protein A